MGNQLFIFSLFAKQASLKSKLLSVSIPVRKVEALCFHYVMRMTKQLFALKFYAVFRNKNTVFVLRKLPAFFDLNYGWF